MTILKIRIRRNTSADWASMNPILDAAVASGVAKEIYA